MILPIYKRPQMVYTNKKAVKNMAVIEELLEALKTQQQTIETLTVKATPHKDRLTAQHVICTPSFPSSCTVSPSDTYSIASSSLYNLKQMPSEPVSAGSRLCKAPKNLWHI